MQPALHPQREVLPRGGREQYAALAHTTTSSWGEAEAFAGRTPQRDPSVCNFPREGDDGEAGADADRSFLSLD